MKHYEIPLYASLIHLGSPPSTRISIKMESYNKMSSTVCFVPFISDLSFCPFISLALCVDKFTNWVQLIVKFPSSNSECTFCSNGMLKSKNKIQKNVIINSHSQRYNSNILCFDWDCIRCFKIVFILQNIDMKWIGKGKKKSSEYQFCCFLSPFVLLQRKRDRIHVSSGKIHKLSTFTSTT